MPKQVTIATIEEQITVYSNLKKACDSLNLNRRTVYNHFKKQGYYLRKGIKLERKELNPGL